VACGGLKSVTPEASQTNRDRPSSRDTRAQSMTDEYNLQRFLEAQDHVYGAVLEELRAGRKSSHWMWFIFPQITGLGDSGAPRPYSGGPFCVFGGTRRAYSAEVANKATKAGSVSSFAKASEDTRCAFLHSFTTVASCVGGWNGTNVRHCLSRRGQGLSATPCLNPHYSQEFVTKPPRRYARRARGAAREEGILETVC